MPNWVTAVNDAPASSAKKTRDTIARWPDDDTGRNSVRPCTTAKTTTCHHDIAGTAVTTTTVPGDAERAIRQTARAVGFTGWLRRAQPRRAPRRPGCARR